MAADKESVTAGTSPGGGAPFSMARGRNRAANPCVRIGMAFLVVLASEALLPSVAAAASAASSGGSRPTAGAKPARPRPRKTRPSPPAEKPPDVPPLESEALLESARALFTAIVENRPELADAFFFPREPFIPLKDVDDPARYHAELVRVYHRDIQRLHARRRSWEGARFVGFRLGTPPRWIEPGREWNKIGYYRTFDARLDYEVAGKARQFIVRTIISWEGRWYVTHLSAVKH